MLPLHPLRDFQVNATPMQTLHRLHRRNIVELAVTLEEELPNDPKLEKIGTTCGGEGQRGHDLVNLPRAVHVTTDIREIGHDDLARLVQQLLETNRVLLPQYPLRGGEGGTQVSVTYESRYSATASTVFDQRNTRVSQVSQVLLQQRYCPLAYRSVPPAAAAEEAEHCFQLSATAAATIYLPRGNQ
ncbi:unnamed protein product [Linum trigynum]|uniref:Uncharacterized protein n=1 Tax=Linum trigynum TaxID=586398 RepID=A0AAV2EL03_9ROSI